MKDDFLHGTSPPFNKRATTCLEAGLALFETLSLSDDADPWSSLMAMELRSAFRLLSSSPTDAGLGKLDRILGAVADVLKEHGYELLAAETGEVLAEIRSSRLV